MEEYQLTSKQLEIINGALLGDGSLIIHKNGTNANFSYLSKSIEHVHFVCDDLADFVMPSHNFYISKYLDKRTNKEYERCDFRTKANPAFTKIYYEWYNNKIKIIPKNLILTPLICLIWYLGDGSLLTHARSQCIHLCTDNFKKDDIENILLPQLEQFESHLIERKTNQYRIYIPRRKIKDFLNYIGECPVKDYLHKWNFQEYKYEPLSNYPEKTKKIIIAYKNGSSPKTIADYFGIDRTTVLRCLEKYGIDSNLNRFSRKKVCFDE